MVKIRKGFFIEISTIILIKLLLEYLYINFIYVVFSYSGYDYVFNFDKYLISWIVVIFGFFILYKKKDINISIMYYFIYLLYVLPNSVYFELSDQNTYFYLMLILPFYFIVFFTTNKNIFTVKSLHNSKIFVLLLSFVLTFMVIMHYIYITGGHMTFSILNVYGFREQYGKASSSGIFGYLNSWVPKIFVVLLFIWSFNFKKYFINIIIFSSVFILFFLSGHKSVFSGLFVVFIIYTIINNKNSNTSLVLYFLLFLSILTILIEYFDMSLVGSILIRRLLFVPPHLNFIYLDYFDNHQFAYWANGPLKYFLTYPYDTNIANVIGTYLGHPKENANTGFIASGYAQAGIFGILIYTFLSIIFFNIINNFSKKLEKIFFISIILVPILTLFLSSDLFTTLLTHGLLISILVLYLYSNKEYILKINKIKYKV